jgi:hypothetical protein
MAELERSMYNADTANVRAGGWSLSIVVKFLKFFLQSLCLLSYKWISFPFTMNFNKSKA